MANNRVLIIDDDLQLHQDYKKILTPERKSNDLDLLEKELFSDNINVEMDHEFELVSAYQGEEGVELVKKSLEENNPYSIAFVDMRMPPGIDGLETISRIKDLDPDIQFVICTAYSDYSWREMISHIGSSERLLILKKPFEIIEVKQIAYSLSMKWDISLELKSRMDALNRSEQKYRTVVDNVTDLIVTLDQNGVVLFKNENKWHYPEVATKGNYLDLVDTEYKQYLSNAIKESYQHANPMIVEYLLKSRDTYELWAEAKLSPVYENGKISSVLLVASDISSRKLVEKKLREDELTGLPNRLFFIEYIEDMLASEERVKDNFSVLLLDIDHFSLINDCFGHDIGDRFLIEISKYIQSVLPPDALCVRISGDEFGIFINDIVADDLVALANRINQDIAQAFSISGFDIYTSASLGVVTGDKTYHQASELFSDADIALSHAKALGRNRFVFYDEGMHEQVVERLNIGIELRHAIKNNEFEVFYQPLIGLDNHSRAEIVGFEALIRWNHPQRGLVGPYEFINVAEETGLIIPISELVMDSVFSQLKEWRSTLQTSEQKKPLFVAINCAAKQFHEQNLPQLLEQKFKQYNINPDCIELELTESSIMEDVESSIQSMDKLRQMGVSLSIDDFGTGYSSFSYLKKLNIQKLKIDRAFIIDMATSDEDCSIVNAMIAMAHRLGIKVVAEGVETDEQLKLLLESGCDYIQGYYYSKPVPAIDASSLLENGLNK